jgi:hypothetical protein
VYSRNHGVPAGHIDPEGTWSGAEEIFGLVWYLREPLFVIGEDANVQVYIIDQAAAKFDIDECMTILTPTKAEAWAMLKTLLNFRVTPRVVVHSGGLTESIADGHFQSLRCRERWYRDWKDPSKPSKRAELMRDRMNQALHKLGLYATLKRPPLPLRTREDQDGELSQASLSGSLYAPSTQEDSDREEKESVQTKLEDGEYILLHEYLNPRQRLRSTERELWRIAEKANLEELLDFAAIDCCPEDCDPALGGITAALQRRITNPIAMVLLLRRLPYPLVALAVRPPRLMVRLGQELAMMGRGLQARRWLEDVPEPEVARFLPLIEPKGTDSDERWAAAQQRTLWDSLGVVLGRDVQQHRTLPQSDEHQVLKLIVALVISFPADMPVDMVCDLVHAWISTHGADARQLLTELRCHRWTSISEVCYDILRGPPPQSDTSAAESSR